MFYLEDQFTDQVPILESLYQQIQYISDLTNELNIHSTDSLENSYILNDEVNMNNLLEVMCKKWSYLYSIHDIDLIYSTLNKDLTWVSNDLWLQRLFDNIFQNTLKHSNATKLEIIVDNNIISFQDNGIGFNIAHNNTGLGLKIIEDISRSLNIKYTLQSNKNGTLFSFTTEYNE